MLALYVEAPFAAFRTFTAGWYRPTAPFLTPSAAYGLALNLAGVEMRLREDEPGHGGKVPATVIRTGLPAVRVAVGAAAGRLAGRAWVGLADGDDPFPRVATVYQQLHNYLVGSTGGARAEATFGSKYNIAPVRREVLVGLRAVVVLDGNADLEVRVRDGLSGDAAGRYGLPFLGDNAFLPDRIEALPAAPRAWWYERVGAGGSVRPRTARLTTWIDRADLSRTRSDLFAPGDDAAADVPPAAWTHISPP